MANKSVFASLVGKLLPRTDAVNAAGAPAYALKPTAALAQLAATGTINATFYADAREQLDQVLSIAATVDPAFIAKTAVYTREQGKMKDMPALLLALLSTLGSPDFAPAFRRVVTNGRMLRSFVQIMRSGVVGRKSLGTRPKRLVQEWLEQASDRDILRASVGQDPSLADIVKMVHPRPASPKRAALYAYLIGRPYDVAALPQIVRDFEAFKADPTLALPDVPFQMLTSLELSAEHWAAIGRQSGWQMVRMNLNTFARHKAFEVAGFAEEIAARLKNVEQVQRSGVLPYQLMMAYGSVDEGVPLIVREALQDAMEVAVANVPALAGKVVICPDVSGSMSSPVTGYRPGATSKVRCIDVAGLMTAALLRTNREARVLPFEQNVVEIDLNPRDTVMTNAAKLAAIGGGATACVAPLELLIKEKAAVDLVIFVSDNQSWVDATQGVSWVMKRWEELKQRNPKARLVCLDIQPYATSQAAERYDILNIGGFSDTVFDLIGQFAEGDLGPDHWVGEIEKITI